MKLLKIEDYHSIVKENEYYHRTLERTNLNCNILTKRF